MNAWAVDYLTKTQMRTCTVGVPFNLNPIVDIGYKQVNLWEMTGMLRLYYNDSYSPSNFIYTTTVYTTAHNRTGEYYTITPQKIGDATFHVKVLLGVNVTVFQPSNSGYDIEYTLHIVDVTNISIPETLSLTIGETYTFTPVITDRNAQTTLTWSSDNKAVATVDENGTVTAVGQGTAVITCRADNGVEAKCTINVKSVPTESIALDVAEKEMAVGSRLQLNAILNPTEGASRNLLWESSDETVATVSTKGLVTAVGTGTCSITATTTDGTDLSASCEITVINNYIYAAQKNAAAGSKTSWPIYMKNEADITAVQFDLTLPEGVTIANNDKGGLSVKKAARSEYHSLNASKLAGNTYRILLYSDTKELIEDNDGKLMDITLDVASGVAPGDYDIAITNVVLSDPDQLRFRPSDMNVTLSILDALLGDVNVDGEVDVADIVALATHILNRDKATDYPRADANGDGSLDVADIVNVAGIILNGAHVKGLTDGLIDPQ